MYSTYCTSQINFRVHFEFCKKKSSVARHKDVKVLNLIGFGECAIGYKINVMVADAQR